MYEQLNTSTRKLPESGGKALTYEKTAQNGLTRIKTAHNWPNQFDKSNESFLGSGTSRW